MKLLTAFILLLCVVVVDAEQGQQQQQWVQLGQDIDGEKAQDWAGGTEKGMAMNGEGTTIAVGSIGHDGSSNGAVNIGHVRVFDLDVAGQGWLQRGDAIEGEFTNDNSGSSVVLSADGMVVGIGAPQSDGGKNTENRFQVDYGQVRVFEWREGEGVWSQRGEAIIGEAKCDFAADGGGLAMDASGTTIVIGAPFNDGSEKYSNKGQVRVFDWDGTIWIQRGDDLFGEAAGDLFGEAVTINGSGETVAVGALHNDGEAEAGRFGCVTCRGSVRVFDWSPSVEEWLQRGDDIDGEQDQDYFGSSVALNDGGNVLVIGSPQTSHSSTRGAVDVYQWKIEKNGIGTWQQRGSRIAGTSDGDVFGSSVSISNSGETIAVGASLHEGRSDLEGQVRIFDWNTDTNDWSQRGDAINGENKYDYSGSSVALSADGNTVASGARHTNDGAGFQAGHVRVFSWHDDDGDTPIVCPEIFDPVWCEGSKYANFCFAKAAGFMESHCTADGDNFCPTVHDPVWCQGQVNVKRKMYSNQCFATAEGFVVKSQCTDKEPTTPSGCPKIFDPVWCEGSKYDNLCFAQAAGFMESHCTAAGDNFCPTVHDPVWCQGKVNVKQKYYSNQCFATAEGFVQSQCTDTDPTTTSGGCPKNIDPVWCEGSKYDNFCFAKAAGFIESHCTADGDNFCPTVHDPVWCQGQVNVEQKKYSNLCFAMAEGFVQSQCTDQDPTTPSGCPKIIDPVFCEGSKYDNLCFAKVAGFVASQCTPDDTFCPDVVDPVICEGSKYDNLCFAKAAGFVDSQCTPDDNFCPDVVDPVICEGSKYDNLCFAKAAGFVASQCSPDDNFCPDVVDPVFCEGSKYDNLCIAKAAGFVDSQCTPGDIFCPDVVDPVWCQGKVNVKQKKYSNLCFAKAEGFVESQCTDKDPDDKDPDDYDFTLDDECEDNGTFRRGKKKDKNCTTFLFRKNGALRKNAEEKCQKKHQGNKVYDYCMKTCNEFGLGDCGVDVLD